MNGNKNRVLKIDKNYSVFIIMKEIIIKSFSDSEPNFFFFSRSRNGE